VLQLGPRPSSSARASSRARIPRAGPGHRRGHHPLSPTPPWWPRSRPASARRCAARRSAPSPSAWLSAAGNRPPGRPRPMTVGVLALQGDFAKHLDAFAELGVEAVAVRRPVELDALCGLVLPAANRRPSRCSSTPRASPSLGRAPARRVGGLRHLCGARAAGGRNPRRPARPAGLRRARVTVRRNGYGRQLASFETELDAAALDASLSGDPAGHCRRCSSEPRASRRWPGVEVLARLVGPVARTATWWRCARRTSLLRRSTPSSPPIVACTGSSSRWRGSSKGHGTHAVPGRFAPGTAGAVR